MRFLILYFLFFIWDKWSLKYKEKKVDKCIHFHQHLLQNTKLRVIRRFLSNLRYLLVSFFYNELMQAYKVVYVITRVHSFVRL